MQRLAIKCQGDFSKLSPAEQAKVNEMENGYGALAIRNIYARSRR